MNWLKCISVSICGAMQRLLLQCYWEVEEVQGSLLVGLPWMADWFSQLRGHGHC